MNKKKYPTLSIVIPTRESDIMLGKCLAYISSQTYPKNKLQVIVCDGASSRVTKKLVEKFGYTWLENKKQLAEPGVSLGLHQTTGSLCMVLAVDNEYHDTEALEKMTSVFEDPSIIAAFPKHESSKEDSLFTKYINIFSDPATHFLYANATNARTFYKEYKTIQHTPLFDVYDFHSSRIRPIIAFAQGFTIRRTLLVHKKSEMDDISPIMRLLEKRKKIAYVHGVSLFHHTVRDASHFFRKQQWAVRNMLQKKEYGLNIRKNTLTKWQKIKIYLYPFYGISFFLPLIVSIIKFSITQEKMWLFHPIIVFISAVAIMYEYATIILHKNTSFFRN